MATRYSEISFLDSALDKDQLNVPIASRIGRVYLKNGTSRLDIYVEINSEERTSKVKIMYKPKSFAKSEIYKHVVEWAKNAVIDYKRTRVKELIRV